MTSPPAPTAPAERLDVLDALRGLALFGIFVINLRAFAGWFAISDETRAAFMAESANRIALFLHDALLHGKFYTLFSLLFGIGFALQLGRADAGDPAFLARYRRRLAVLLGFGLIHMTLLWDGDILAVYALCGFVLVLFRGLTDRALLTWAVALILLPVPWYAAMLLTGINPGRGLMWLGDQLWVALGFRTGIDSIDILGSGSWRDLFYWNVLGPFYRFGGLIAEGRFFKVLGVFLIGLWAGRRLIAGSLLDDRPLLVRVLTLGLVVGIPGNLLFAWLLVDSGPGADSAAGLVQALVYALAVVPLGLAYAAGFALLWRRALARRALATLAPAGRLALTTYLSQTLVGISLYGVGFGVVGTMGPADWTLFAALVFTVQVLLARAWLRRFRFGPMEALWRRLTYGSAAVPRAARAQPSSA